MGGGGPHVVGHRTSTLLTAARVQWLDRTGDDVGDLWGRRMWDQATRRGVWGDHALITALFGTGSAEHEDEPGDLAEGPTDAFVDTFSALDHDQTSATDGLPPARSQCGRSAALAAAAGGAGPEADESESQSLRGRLAPGAVSALEAEAPIRGGSAPAGADLSNAQPPPLYAHPRRVESSPPRSLLALTEAPIRHPSPAHTHG